MRYQQYMKVKPNAAFEGDLLVWHVTNGKSFFLPVASIDDAKLALWTLAMRDLWLDDMPLIPGRELVGMNAQGLMVWEDSDDGYDWFEWYNEFGADIREVMDAEQEASAED